MNKKEAWYIGCTSDQIAKRVILVGDPDRVSRISEHLDNVNQLPIHRGLKTITGSFNGIGVTVSAFGMGAPIAAIVLHELQQLGARIFLRIGTAIALPPVELGDFIIANKAHCHEGTSRAYAMADHETQAHQEVIDSAIKAITDNGGKYRVGDFASYDGFYRDMFAIEDAYTSRVEQNLNCLSAEGVVAVDMETSALLTVGQALGCKAGSLCVATVNSLKHHKIANKKMAISEQDLFIIALHTITNVEYQACIEQ